MKQNKNLKGQGSFENFWQNFQHYCNRRYFVQFSLRTIRQKSIVWSVFRFIFRIKWSPVAAIALIWRAINWLSLYFEKYTFSYLNEKSSFTASSQITFRHMAVPISLIPSHFMFENMSVRIVCLPNKNLFYSFLSLLRNPAVENFVALICANPLRFISGFLSIWFYYLRFHSNGAKFS